MADPLAPRSDSFPVRVPVRSRGARPRDRCRRQRAYLVDRRLAPLRRIPVVVDRDHRRLRRDLDPARRASRCSAASRRPSSRRFSPPGSWPDARPRIAEAQLTFEHLFSGFSDRLMPLVIVGLLYLAGTVVDRASSFGALSIGVVGMSGLGALMSRRSDSGRLGDAGDAGPRRRCRRARGDARRAAADDGVLVRAGARRCCGRRAGRGDEGELRRVPREYLAVADLRPVGIVLAIVASIPFGLGWLVLGPVFAASVYASYKDIFGAPA